VYHFFKNHKPLYWSLLLASTLLFAFFASKIYFEEDISKLLPSAEEGGAEELVFSNLKVKDKVFILFNPLSDTVSTEDLIDTGDRFVAALLEKDSSDRIIHNVLYQIDGSVMQNAVAFLYDNAPIFLKADDYRKLDSLLTPEQIDAQMAENYATLRSPAGAVFREMIAKDPIALRKIFLGEASDAGAGLGGNFAFYNGHIFTPDTSTAVAFISPNFKSFDSKLGVKLVQRIEDEIEVFQKENPGIEILYHGAPVQSVNNARRIKLDLLLTISISLIIIIIILLYCFRNKSTIGYLIAPVVWGVLFALAMMYWIKGSMSLMAMGIGAIVMGVAFSYCIHIITHYKYVNDPIKVLKDQTVPIILSALTTIGAFIGLLFTQSELLQDFGLFASFGLLGTTIFCLLFLPQFFNPGDTVKKSEKAFRFIEKINNYPFDKQKWLVVLLLIITVICIIFSGRVQFDSDLRNIGYDSPRILRSRDLLAQKTSGEKATVYFASVATDLDSALIYNKKLTERLDKLAASGEIQSYSSPASLFVPTCEQQQYIARWNDYWNDGKREDVERKMAEIGEKYRFNERSFKAFYEMLDKDYQPVSLYDSGVIPEALMENFIEYTDGRYLAFVPVIMDKAQVVEIGRKVVENDPQYLVIDQMFYTSGMVEVIHEDFNTTLGVAALFVLIILLLSYQSLLLAGIAFLPMGLSWYIVLGFMGMFGLQFNLINIVISTFIFGVGVDYSIFVMEGLLASYRAKESTLTYHKTAIFFSALILIIVVASLLFAVHPAISSIGATTLIGMAATILIAYVLLPLLFKMALTNRTAKGKAPLSLVNILSFGKQPNLARQLKNNYLYKGNSVERALQRELRATQNYETLNPYFAKYDALLDFGCGCGFTAYQAALVHEEMKICGYDRDKEALAIAENCYCKTATMRFTDSAAVVSRNSFDMVLINNLFDVKQDAVSKLFSKAKAIAVRKDFVEQCTPSLRANGFMARCKTGAFWVFEK
ncbi:MMPL family transporter, partial [Bacteroidales bacterium OttesenSCG-928-J16]|nr:MMPL family transporter [Bacteroidales bacterium OttesenSCG-928-J16]